jgi:endonuclease-3
LIVYFCPQCGKSFSQKEFKENRFCGNCGKFLTSNDRRLMEQNRRDDEAPSSTPIADLKVRVEKLLEFGEKVTAEELVPVLIKEAAKDITDPFAFVLAGVLDRGAKAEVIWTIPYYIKKQLGQLDPYFFANASIEEIAEIFRKLPRKPRYMNDAPYTVKELSEIIVNDYNGQTQKLWENRGSQAVKTTLERIHGVGPGIASMIILLLERWFKVYFDDIDHRKMDVKPDVHIIRVFYKLGFISEPTSAAALKAARRLNPEFPGAMDAPAWYIGRNWCTASMSKCDECPVVEVCPKISSITYNHRNFVN